MPALEDQPETAVSISPTPVLLGSFTGQQHAEKRFLL